MTRHPNELLGSENANHLMTMVEEATRATKDSPRRFLEPAQGTLNRAKSRRHHLIFGRRGSGKTSLLRKAEADLTIRRVPTAFVDLEAFKGHKYPDVLLSILIETLNAFDSWLNTAAVTPATKTSFWRRLFGRDPERPPLDRKKVDIVQQAVRLQIASLSALLHSEDGAALNTAVAQATATAESKSSQASMAGGIQTQVLSNDFALSQNHTSSQSTDASATVKEEHRRNKMDVLHRKIIDFQKLFEQIVSISNGDGFIFLDDLYHISKDDQAHVLDYFHRIVKGRSLWLKVGSIKHRTDWYRHGNPPIGLKLGDDADEIDLDITLEKYELARSFLTRILDQLVAEAQLGSHKDLLAEGGVERLVLASGGVARDFLTIFRRAVDIARERGETYRGEKVNAEDVNAAAGEHDASKRDELKRDTADERKELETALATVQTFCVKNGINCFLVERDRDSDGHRLIGELVDLRFLHVVGARTTVREIQGKLFSAFMLDISQYTGDRKRRDLEMVAFWKREGMDRLRLSKYVIDPANLKAPQMGLEIPAIT